MNRPSDSNGKYVGKHLKQPAVRRVSAGLTVLLLLVLFAARLGTEAFKVLSYYDLFLGGRGLLNYGDVSSVDIGSSMKSLPVLDQLPDSEPEGDYILRLDDGTRVVYNGHTYVLNTDLTTILVMGIDRTIADEALTELGESGQADTVLLVGLDTKTGQATVLNISREACAQVEAYSAGGRYIETRYEQLTLAYAYGDGRETSCENMMRAVSRLLYNLPISSYVAIDMEGILAANEAVGGVRLKSMIDYTAQDGTSVHEGDTVELHGRDADHYLRTRSWALDGNSGRMDRQKQYLTEFAKLVQKSSRRNLTFPVTLFSSLSPYMVTSLSIPDVTFLSRCFLENGARFSFRGIDGTFDRLNGSAIYYLDDVDLFEAVLQVFYLRAD